jgi:hypothetical protein
VIILLGWQALGRGGDRSSAQVLPNPDRAKPMRGAVVSEHEPGDERHPHESALLHAQEHKGYGEDEGEREELLEREGDDESETSV